MRDRPETTILKGLLLIGVLGLCLGAADTARAQTERLFYHVDQPESYERLKKHIDQISIVAPAAYSVDSDGVVWGRVDPRVRELAASNDVAVMPLIKNPEFDQDLLRALLHDSTARNRAIASMVEQCEKHGYAGFQFDFENIHISDRDAYTQFYREAARALHEAGYQISIAVVHRPSEFAGPTTYHKWLFKNWRAGYDPQGPLRPRGLRIRHDVRAAHTPHAPRTAGRHSVGAAGYRILFAVRAPREVVSGHSDWIAALVHVAGGSN